MLKGLYTCIAESGNRMNLEVEITLNSDHPLFEGHFPGKPVLPGVCQLHIVKELVERHIGRSVNCRSIRELKFLSPILPPHDARLRVTLVLTTTDDTIGVQGIISAEGMQKTKIKATFV